MPYCPIIGTLGYLVSEDRHKVLLIERNARPDDEHFGKVNGLGGKLERDEDVVSGLRREFREEAAIELTTITLRGTISWPGFGRNGEDWLGFVFLAHGFEGTLPTANEEGALVWHDVSALLAGELPLWDGDPHFLPLVFDDDPRPFHGVMPYEQGHAVGWSYVRL